MNTLKVLGSHRCHHCSCGSFIFNVVVQCLPGGDVIVTLWMLKTHTIRMSATSLSRSITKKQNKSYLTSQHNTIVSCVLATVNMILAKVDQYQPKANLSDHKCLWLLNCLWGSWLLLLLIWILGQFGTRTIWHRGQFGTAENLALGQFGTKHLIWLNWT